jgi:glycosyltransferase involved in cell wall biosynthesis
MNERYRVLVVASHPAQYAVPLYRRMARHPNLDIQVAYCSLQGAEKSLDPGFGVEVAWDIPLLDGYSWVHVPNRSPRPRLERFFGLVNPGLYRLVSRGRFDAVVNLTGYAYFSSWLLFLSAKLRGVPLLFGTDATSLAPRDHKTWKAPLKRAVLPHIFRLADVALAPSSATVELFQRLGVPLERIVLTPFVVDNEYWVRKADQVDRAAVRASWGVEDGRPVVLFCAKLQPWKRPQDVVRAFARSAVANAYLVMAGEGPLREQLEREAAALGIADRVKFLGFVNQSALPSVYRCADLLVLPSEYDPCPVVVCESMLCGCPVVLSDAIRGRFDIVRQGQTGFIYPCGNIDSLARVLDEVLPDQDRLRRMGRAARQLMKTWSPRENVQAVLFAIERAVQLRLGR